jgi:Fe-S-cluster-containing dehydrogenase component
MLSGLDAAEREQLVELLALALRATPRDRLIADATCRACNWPACGADCPVDHSVQDLSRE